MAKKDLQKKNIIKRMVSFALIGLSVATLIAPITVYAKKIKVPLDTTVEPDRNAGTDLYDTKCYYKNVLPLNISISSGGDSSVLHDERYSTSLDLSEGTEIKVSCETTMHGIYVIWDCFVREWTLKIGEESYTYGKNGFLHEYLELPVETKEFTIVIPNGNQNIIKDLNNIRISDIMAFESADVPIWVQKWEPVCEEADILLVSTHSDDEQIFLGGITPTYQVERNQRVQLVFFAQHWNGEKVREHEKLNGLWLAGAKYYPIMGTVDDAYSTSYETATQTMSEDDALSFLVGAIRRTHPLVIVTQDIEGEYGHGQHMFLAHNVIKAFDSAADEGYDGGSLANYGTWQAQKLYLHIYGENPTHLDMRTPLNNFGGKRAIDVARQAYLCHQSQQWCDFTVDDYGPYSISDFGLYATKVGEDVNKNDLMENITSYEELDEIKKQEEEKARLEEEQRKAEQEEKERLEKEAEQNKEDPDNKKEKEKASLSGIEIFVIIAVVILVLMSAGFGTYIIISNNNRKKRRRRKHHRRRR